MLEAAGLEPLEERAYRLLVEVGQAEPAMVAERLDLDVPKARELLESLHAKGMASRAPADGARFAPVPPDVALGPLLLRGQQRLERARGAVAQLTEEYRGVMRRRDAAQLVEVVVGAAALRQRLEHLQRNTREEALWLCKAGYVAMPSAENREELEMLDRGVRYQVIYERSLLEEPGMLANVAEGIARGEVARAADALPVRLAIFDRSIGLCPLVPGGQGGGAGEPTTALVRGSILLDALIALFESYWATASPLRLSGSGQLSEAAAPEGPEPPLGQDQRHLLSLLLAGVTDQAIASHLGVSLRTVQRRIQDLMHRAGVRTRVQLAWQAARRGWLSDP